MYTVLDYYEDTGRDRQRTIERGDIWMVCFPYRFSDDRIERVYPDGLVKVESIHGHRPRVDRDGREAAEEFSGVIKFKRRPVIVLSTLGDHYQDRAWRGQQTVLVAPVRSLRDDVTNEYRADPEFVWNSICYRYRSIFYLPCSNKYDFHEAALHLDDMRTINCAWLSEKRPARLSDDALKILDGWLHFYIYGKLGEGLAGFLNDYREYLGQHPDVRTGLFQGNILRPN